ncbi:MAG: phosphopantothenate/pantothenate synthetase [Candidatus Thorarchaeota archaeon]|nr:phosphopantothenate/pantothenate synthetase [Candidatus Thorarchaeota archaeon]
MTKIEIPADHPRRDSLEVREKIIEGHDLHIVATAGLLAHGRGEAFDYLIGEHTTYQARLAMRAAVAATLTAKHPVISVNGNICSLIPDDLVEFSEIVRAPLEINLFYYRKEREDAILKALHDAGAKDVLGTHDRPSTTIPELSSNRRKVDPEGIGSADVVIVPLEDGDRTEALCKMGKFVITVDLNPISRTSVYSNITIVDNIVRVLPIMVEMVHEMKKLPHEELVRIVQEFDNEANIRSALNLMIEHLSSKASQSIEELKEGKK